MLKDDFYKIRQIDTEGDSVKAVLELNAGHHIFKGHFPGTPVVPGVCMMQMVKEMVEMHAGAPVLLSKADSMKFLSVIDPRVNNVVLLVLSLKTTDEAVEVNASLLSGETVCFKFKGRFIVANR